MRNGEPRGKRVLRCAIYTRKSTEEGLDQEFNSLDAQREACAAYILSQRHEGWVLVPEQYDDGGFSGGNMERPAMQQLLAEVRAGKVDVIVVYKVDRLTRALSDFAKIVEVLDAKGASFVSVTQAFNTTTSMGRLTLNVLLSFAQFDREVTGERIRDKIAASKKKGLWMGGPVPLGYEVLDRKLIVNQAEAETVRCIFGRYLELGSVRELVAALGAEGRRTKVQIRTSGPHRGGIPFARGGVLHLLKNRTYLGHIIHKGASYPGEHEPIVPAELWGAVQARLAVRDQIGTARTRVCRASLLVGLLYDGLGRRMSPSHANKQGKRYRYYVTHEQQRRDREEPVWRVPAHDLEQMVLNQLQQFLTDGSAVHNAIGGQDAGDMESGLLR
ncbi:MAG TPA: recombinase family protein, partial [Chloroflexota bacterium]|nr:recombinase family protein [Chloroflexota bacterium]